MVSRCEVDMVEIKTKFERNYRKSLESFIKVLSEYYTMRVDIIVLYLCQTAVQLISLTDLSL